jgi:hypothetical protein
MLILIKDFIEDERTEQVRKGRLRPLLGERGQAPLPDLFYSFWYQLL